jgi:hypothetical protein
MDILRNLFGNLTSGIIRLLVTVGILAAAYVFIVRPVLDTTSDAIKEANKSLEKNIDVSGLPGLDDVVVDANAGANLSRELQRSFARAQKRGELRQLNRCIQRAAGDIPRIRACARRF